MALVEYKVDGAVGTITINRPEALNALNSDVLTELENVFDNVAFGLKLKKVPKDEIKRKVLKMLAIVDLKGYEKRSVAKLSGGQQQRVAIARALVCDPDIILLDEPLGALDLKLRKSMQLELKEIQQQTEKTFIYVTHDQEEALTMSDRVVVMNNGVIEQIGTPEDIYNEPVNAFVADFIGEANILNGMMMGDCRVRILGRELECVDKGFGTNTPVDVVIRPEDIIITEPKNGQLTGRVENVTFKGVHYEMSVYVGKCEILVHSTNSAAIGSTVGLRVIPFNIQIMNKLLPIPSPYRANIFRRAAACASTFPLTRCPSPARARATSRTSTSSPSSTRASTTRSSSSPTPASG